MHDELDNLIDGALARYSSAEPLAGIEQRVLDRVRLADARRRRWRWTLVLAAPALAAALVILAPTDKPVPVAVVAPEPAPIAFPTRPEVPAAAPVPRRIVRARAPEPPKRDQFPTISPLTGEERLLVQIAQASPQLLLGQPAAEIEIKPIEIAPLQIDGARSQ